MAIRAALSAELTAAMRRRDTAVVTALRSALSATANAEAAPPSPPLETTLVSEHVAGATRGLGATEVARVDLSEDQVREIVAHERADLMAHAERLTRLCRRDEADAARRAAEVLAAVLKLEEVPSSGPEPSSRHPGGPVGPPLHPSVGDDGGSPARPPI